MLIFDDNSDAVILDSIHTPTLTDHFWILDLEMRDFTLTPLLVLEEIVCPTITIRVGSFTFDLPANWNVLVYAEDTHQLDVVEVAELAGKEFTAMVYGPDAPYVKPGRLTVVDYIPDHRNVAPSLNKHQMLCHPISPDTWINVAPSDAFNKYLKDISVGDILD